MSALSLHVNKELEMKYGNVSKQFKMRYRKVSLRLRAARRRLATVDERRQLIRRNLAVKDMLKWVICDYDPQADYDDPGIFIKYARQIEFACRVLSYLGLARRINFRWEGTYRLFELQVTRGELLRTEVAENYNELRDLAEFFDRMHGTDYLSKLPKDFSDWQKQNI